MSKTYKPSYWNCPGIEPLSPLTLGQVIDNAAERWGDEEAFVSIYQGHRFTFKEVREKADHLAGGLLQLGLRSGDRLGIWGHNSSEWYISRLAAARAGLIAVQIDPAYQAPQLLHSINHVDMKAIICAEFYKNNSCYQIVRALIPELDSYPESGVELQAAKVPSMKVLIIMSDIQYRGSYRLTDVIKSAQPETLKEIRVLQTVIQPDEGCAIQFSSGTTGSPKGALLSHHNLVNNALFLAKHLEQNVKESRSLVATQFCHTSGSVGGIILGICSGITCVVSAPVFDAKKMLEGIIQESCTYILATPSLYVDMIATSKDLGLKVTTLQVAFYAGAPCSQQLAMQMKETLNTKKLFPGYGMTEVSFVFSARPGDTLEQTTTTVGTVAEHTEVKVVDQDGRMVPMGTPGELWVRGYSVLLGYWKDEERTRQFIGPDGWAKTGDKFILQEGGYGRIVGRVKDMIIRIADNIFPAEIEDFFMMHPNILEAQAFGVPDPKVGEEICVYLRLKQGANLTEKDIRKYCENKIAEYRIPRYIRFVEEFERTAIGKVQKYRLLEKLQREICTTSG